MTERMTVDEAKKAGILKPDGAPRKGSLRVTQDAELRQALAEVKRLKEMWKLATLLSRDGHIIAPEYRFHPARRWHIDLALIDVMIAIEIDGGGWVGGAHHRKRGRDNDNEKDRALQELNWRVLRFSWDAVFSGAALDCIRRFAK